MGCDRPPASGYACAIEERETAHALVDRWGHSAGCWCRSSGSLFGCLVGLVAAPWFGPPLFGAPLPRSRPLGLVQKSLTIVIFFFQAFNKDLIERLYYVREMLL